MGGDSDENSNAFRARGLAAERTVTITYQNVVDRYTRIGNVLHHSR